MKPWQEKFLVLTSSISPRVEETPEEKSGINGKLVDIILALLQKKGSIDDPVYVRNRTEPSPG